MNLNNRGSRGTLRERHIGEGKLRELMAKAAGMEKEKNLLGGCANLGTGTAFYQLRQTRRDDERRVHH